MEFIVINSQYQDIHLVDTFESAIWADRYSGYGDFELYLAPTENNLSSLRQDYYLWSNESEHTMIIEDIRVESNVEEGNKLTATGRSLESLLDRRIVWDQTILSGDFQNGIKKLLDDAIISPTDPDRKISNFRFEYSTDPYITSLTISTQITGTNLYDTIKNLCDANNLGFKIILTINNELVFTLYAGVDRSFNQIKNPDVIFSPNFDNLINSNYFSSKRGLKTVTVVAGEGEGLNRTRVIVPIDSGAGKGLDRREMYTDARDISSNDGEITPAKYKEQLIQRGKNYLAENTISKAFEGNADTINVHVFGEDFFMGDIVQIANEYGIESSARVTEVIRSQSEEGLEVYPTFSTIE